MKINIISDLHLEFSNYYHKVPADTKVCVIAGDAGVGLAGVEWAKWVNDNTDIAVIYIAGNHEFYRSHIMSETYDKLRDRANELNGKNNGGFYFLQNETVEINGVRFIGATLWTDYKFVGNQAASMAKSKFYMNDYRTIYRDQQNLITSDDILEEFNKSYNYIDQVLSDEFNGPTVVITHHGVSEQSIHPAYKNKGGNEYFVSDLTDMIYNYQPELWIHGHTHANVDYMIGKTRVITNPRGYVVRNNIENPFFQPDLVVDV